jgi:hypothetical protein
VGPVVTGASAALASHHDGSQNASIAFHVIGTFLHAIHTPQCPRQRLESYLCICTCVGVQSTHGCGPKWFEKRSLKSRVFQKDGPWSDAPRGLPDKPWLSRRLGLRLYMYCCLTGGLVLSRCQSFKHFSKFKGMLESSRGCSSNGLSTTSARLADVLFARDFPLDFLRLIGEGPEQVVQDRFEGLLKRCVRHNGPRR